MQMTLANSIMGKARASKDASSARTFFIIFVDAIFTTLFERPFTNVFDVMAQTPAAACVYPARTTG
jgi:hypothetical protein